MAAPGGVHTIFESRTSLATNWQTSRIYWLASSRLMSAYRQCAGCRHTNITLSLQIPQALTSTLHTKRCSLAASGDGKLQSTLGGETGNFRSREKPPPAVLDEMILRG